MGRNRKQDEYYKKCINIVPEFVRVNTKKETARIVAQMCSSIGVKHVVCSPGSRSAPLVLAFEEQKKMIKRVIPDERVAGFSALGISIETQKPVALFCTSGTATLNLSPAICEAYYQKVPLIVITADRPEYARNTGENQTIIQPGIYKNFIEKEINVSYNQKINQKFIAKLSEVFKTAITTKKPVHINISFEEPLYELDNYSENKKNFIGIKSENHKRDDLKKIANEINLYKKITWVAGLQNIDSKILSKIKKEIQKKGIVFFADITSNCRTRKYNCSEEFFELQIKKFNPDLHPELLITSEGQIVSKRFRTYFKKYPPKKHIHISEFPQSWYLFDCPYKNVCLPISEWKNFISFFCITDLDFKSKTIDLEKQILNFKKLFNKNKEWSDWNIYNKIVDFIRPNYVVHLGNSSAVRYASYQSFPLSTTIRSNRGTSGIDGCVSTAIAAASVSLKKHILIVGDISFMYDHNAFWQEILPQNLIIFLINNGGGNIFDLIQGPSSVPNFEKYFRTNYHPNFKKLSGGFGLQYYFCKNFKQLEVTFDKLTKKSSLTIVEIKSNPIINEKIFKDYFKKLNLIYEPKKLEEH